MPTVAVASGLGSGIFAIVALLVISLAVLLILRYYLPLRTTPAYLLLPVFFALGLPASIILLVPVDLASSARSQDVASNGFWLPQRVLLVSWRLTYWLTFALTWFILPIMAEYSDAGYREPKARFLYSIKSNARYQAMVLGSAILAGIYVFLSAGIEPHSLKGLVMALAYCWGLVLAIYLMGHGLVAIPRTLFRNSSISGRLRRIHVKASKVHQKKEESILKAQNLEAEVAELSRSSRATTKYREWIDELEDISTKSYGRPSTLSQETSVPQPVLPAVITEAYLANLTRQYDRALHHRIRWEHEWKRLVQEATDTEGILDSVSSRSLTMDRKSPQASWLERLTPFTPYTRYVYYYHLVPAIRILIGIILTLASACIIWSEVVKAAFPSLSIISLTVTRHAASRSAGISLGGQAVAALWICYMCSAALHSVTIVKVWRGRALVRRNTAYESAFWYAMQVARLSVPLAYNFLTFLQPALYRGTTFYAFLGTLIDLTPLGQWFDYLFPVFILLPVAATLFNLYGRVKNIFGIGAIDYDDDDDDEASSHPSLAGYGTGGWRQGRDLIERERTGPLRALAVNGPSYSDEPRSRPTFPATPSERSGAARTAYRGGLPVNEEADAADRESYWTGLAHRMRNTVELVRTRDEG